MVGIKFIVLAGLSIAGITFLKAELLSPSSYPPTSDIFFSLAITFFAFEGFRIITNTAEDMPNPSKNTPQSNDDSHFIGYGALCCYCICCFW